MNPTNKKKTKITCKYRKDERCIEVNISYSKEEDATKNATAELLKNAWRTISSEFRSKIGWRDKRDDCEQDND